MADQPTTRRYAHAEGITHVTFDNNRHLVTCGHDSDVRTFLGIEDDNSEFTVSTETVSAICPYTVDGRDMVAVAIDNYTVQAFTREGKLAGLLMRFTAPITFLSLDHTHMKLAAGSCDFLIRTIELHDFTQVGCLRGHEAPVLCVEFDPLGQLLVSSSCDGSMMVWDMKDIPYKCVKKLNILHKCNDVAMAKSICTVSWQPQSGQLLAVPVETGVKVYQRGTWDCINTLTDSAHKEAINVVRWSGCGQYLASGGVDGVVLVWEYSTLSVIGRYSNEKGIGITSLVWNEDQEEVELESDTKTGLYYADKEGYIGWFQGAWPGRGSSGRSKDETTTSDDPLVNDSLLMEGIPPDAIFGNDDVMDGDEPGDDDVNSVTPSGSHGYTGEDDDIVQPRKRPRLLEEEESDGGEVDDKESLMSSEPGHAHSRPLAPPTSSRVMVPTFSDKMIEVYQSPLLPSSTPHTLSHHFLLYNMVGVVRCHSDDDTPMIEVEFHNTTVHHSFSIPNHHGNSMASLNESCLVLACQRNEGNPSQLHCLHFSCWDHPNKEWNISLPSKESATGVALGNGWVAVGTDKQLLRVFSLGGMQRDVICVAGVIVGVAGWGSRLAVIYQEPPCTEKVFQLKVWVVDVERRKQIVPRHSLPLSLHSSLEWFGFSEGGRLVTYDTKGMVRLLDSAHYGGLSWIPILDTTKQLGNKSDHYFIVGMTHDPEEIRGVLCKGISFPSVHPKPVMTVLPLHLPLCDPLSERTQLEAKYLQEVLLGNGSLSKAQALMKMFALACKEEQNYRALEIAKQMNDVSTLNLALTYASRTQHHTLARNISDLLSNLTDSNQAMAEEEEEEEEVGLSDIEIERDVAYMENRANVLRQRVQLGNGSTRSKRDEASSRMKQTAAKIGRPLERPMVPNNAHQLTAAREEGVPNETRELFSDEETEREVEDEAPPTATPISTPLPSLTGKRPNPFKMTTPECRKVQKGRKSSFLDNIGQRSEREEEERRRETEAKRQRGGGGGGG